MISSFIYPVNIRPQYKSTDALAWLNEHMGKENGRWRKNVFVSNIFYFKNSEDASFFILKWK